MSLRDRKAEAIPRPRPGDSFDLRSRSDLARAIFQGGDYRTIQSE